jgi:ribosome-binding protein aMBF1 (putative translation factor)
MHLMPSRNLAEFLSTNRVSTSSSPARVKRGEKAVDDHKEDFANQLRRYRRRAGLSQWDLVEKLKISQITLKCWEEGVIRPRPEFLLPLANALSLTDEEQNAFFRLLDLP